MTEIPAVFLLYDSRFWSGIFLLVIFAVSVWNGGGFYIEVFGRKFERELESLRKELAEAISRSERSSPTLGPQSDDDLTVVAASSGLNSKVVSPGVSEVELPLETIPVIPLTNGAHSTSSSVSSSDTSSVAGGDAETRKDR